MKEIPGARALMRDKPAAVICLVLALGTLGLYAPVLRHAFIDFDDDLYVTANPMVNHGWSWRAFAWAWTTSYAGNWHPLTWLSHLTDCSLFGIHPAGPHAVNALLHAANTVLLFLLLRRMTGALWRCAAVAALFGWHPLHVESVAWAAERKDVLSAFFFFLTLWFYAGFALKKRARDYWLALLCFGLGLLSKPMLVTLPFVLWLLDYWPLHRFGPGTVKRLVLEKAPFLALSAASSVVTYCAQKSWGSVAQVYPFYYRAENAVLTYGLYLGRMLWPARLAVVYPFDKELPRLEVCVCWLVLVALTWLALSRPRRGYWATGWFWYLGTLVPAIGLVQVGLQASADRYTYIPLIGIFIMAVWGAADLAGTWRLPAWASALAAGLALAACAVLTERQLSYWTDSGTLFRHALAVTKGNDPAWNSLGVYLMAQGDEKAAFRCFNKAVTLASDNDAAWYNLGTCYQRRGRYEEALRCFTASARLRERPTTYYAAGQALAAEHQPRPAAMMFAKAVELDPTYMEARMKWADCLTEAGRNEEAARQYRQVLSQDPGQVDAYCGLAFVLAQQGANADAIEQLRQALRLHPADAVVLCGLGNLLVNEGKLDQAAAEYRAALASKPGSPEIHCNLGVVLAAQGRRQQAVEEFTEALRLAPNFAQAKEELKALTGK